MHVEEQKQWYLEEQKQWYLEEQNQWCRSKLVAGEGRFPLRTSTALLYKKRLTYQSLLTSFYLSTLLSKE